MVAPGVCLLMSLIEFVAIGAKFTSISFASVDQNFALASEHIADRCRNGPDPSRPAQILMYDQPCRAECWRLLRPHADHVSRGIAEKACKLGDAYSVSRSF